jgi:glutamine amidotransferase
MTAIIQYNAGNIQSVANALDRLGESYLITDDATMITGADRVILPGVGEAASAMQYLQAKGLDTLIPRLQQPVLGICLGMQLMCGYSEEGDTKGMGIFDTIVSKFPPKDLVPHMGWNNLMALNGNLFTGIGRQDDVYFVHSYYASLCRDTIATADYIIPFSAALQQQNFYAVQFHPEKSGKAGSRILKNFISL